MLWTQDSTARGQKSTMYATDPVRTVVRRKGLLLIDDDEFFRALFMAICESRGIPAESYASLAELTSFAALKEYDVAIFDYYLESFKGPEIAEYVDIFFKDLPVVMISGGEVNAEERLAWPPCIRHFVSKSAGPYAIIDHALEQLGVRAPKRAVN